jgi:hypothetical protein
MQHSCIWFFFLHMQTFFSLVGAFRQQVVILFYNNWFCSWFKKSMAVTLAQGEGLQILGRLDLQADIANAANAGAVAVSCRHIYLRLYLSAGLHHQQVEAARYTRATQRYGLGTGKVVHNNLVPLVPVVAIPPAHREWI